MSVSVATAISKAAVTPTARWCMIRCFFLGVWLPLHLSTRWHLICLFLICFISWIYEWRWAIAALFACSLLCQIGSPCWHGDAVVVLGVWGLEITPAVSSLIHCFSCFKPFVLEDDPGLKPSRHLESKYIFLHSYKDKFRDYNKKSEDKGGIFRCRWFMSFDSKKRWVVK